MKQERRASARRAISALAAAMLAGGAACSGGGGSGEDPALELDAGPPFVVSGTLIAASGSAVDSDTNDLFAPFASNDSATAAQEIPNPVTLGGHANLARAGPPEAPDGRTTVAGDLADWYRVSIAADQDIRLVIAEDGSDNDLDLELRTLDETLVASSATTSRTEQIRVATTDDYYVVVVATSGFSNYTLSIGQAPSVAAAASAEPAFVPGEIVVRYRDDLRGPLAAMNGLERARSLGMRHVAGSIHGPMLWAAHTPAERRAALRALGLEPATPSLAPEAADVPDGGEASREDTRRILEGVRAQPGVRSADLNYLRQPTATPADEFFPLQWHYDQINLPQAWDVVDPDSGVVVAVLDTGVKAEHPDLAPQLVSGYDFVSDPERGNDGDVDPGCDADPDDPGDGSTPGSSSYHGTHVIGTVAAHTSLQPAGDAEGVAGVAWNARVMPLRVLGVGGGTDFDIMTALRYAADRDNACGVTPGSVAPIVNMSLGGPDFSQGFQDLISELRNVEGMIFVAAAGNGASSLPSYPAAYDGVISVSATGPSKTLAPYSSFGSTIDVAAPGGDFSRDIDGDGFPDGVLSTFFDEAQDRFIYTFFQGTSMASPHMAGVVALMLGINPLLTPFDIDNALNAGEITEDIGSAELFGNGLIDAVKAANKAAEGGGGSTVLDPFLRVDPGGLNYGFLADALVISASNGGNDAEPLTIESVRFTSDDGAAWLTVAPESVDAQGLGRYRASVDRSALADGLYTGTIAFDSDRNDVNVRVIVQVGDPTDAQADAGHHFILLVDLDTLDTVDIVEADAVDGQYPFRFDDVDPGTYVLVAGTDSDGDLFICDPGEACGGYPTTETIVPIRVDSDRVGLRFATGFSGAVGAVGADAAASAGRGYAREIGLGPER